MKLAIKLRKPTRRCRCHVPGCRSRDAYKITRRDDVNGNPLYLCDGCIKDINAAHAAFVVAEAEKKKKLDAQIEAEMKSHVAESRQKQAENEAVIESAIEAAEKPKTRSRGKK